MGVVENNVYQFGGMFYFEMGSTVNIISNGNTYTKCFPASEGSVFYLPPGSSLTDTSSLFSENVGVSG